MRYEIKGWTASVTLVVGHFVFRLTLDEARALLEAVETVSAVEIRGSMMVPIPVATANFTFYLPLEEAARVPGYLRSAIEHASGPSQ
jgi:hypothetical protein